MSTACSGRCRLVDGSRGCRANCMRDLVGIHFSRAGRIRLVLDNLSTHSTGRFTGAFRPTKHGASCTDWSSTTSQGTPAGSIWSRSRSAVLARQCLDRRIDTFASLVAETAVRKKRRRMRPRQMDIHNREGSRQNEPGLSKACSQLRPSSTSQDLCAEIRARPELAAPAKWRTMSQGRRGETSGSPDPVVSVMFRKSAATVSDGPAFR